MSGRVSCVPKKETFLHEFCARFGLNPRWDYRRNSPLSLSVCHRVSSVAIYICVVLAFGHFVYDTANLFRGKSKTVIVVTTLAQTVTRIALISVILVNRRNTLWKSLLKLATETIQSGKMVYKILAKLAIGHAVFGVILVLEYFLIHDLRNLWRRPSLVMLFLEYLAYLYVILMGSFVWYANAELDELNNSLKAARNVNICNRNEEAMEFLEEIQRKYKRVTKMVGIINRLFGNIMFISILLTGVNAVASVARFLLKDNSSFAEHLAKFLPAFVGMVI